MTSGTALARAAAVRGRPAASRGWGALASGSGRGFLIACAVAMLALVTSRRWPAPCPVTPGQPVPVGWPRHAGAGLGPAGRHRLALPGLGRPPLRETLGDARSQR